MLLLNSEPATPEERLRARVAVEVYVQTSAALGSFPIGLRMGSAFDGLGLGDVEINDIAERCAKMLGVSLPMPVTCNTLADLGLLLLHALEKRS